MYLVLATCCLLVASRFSLLGTCYLLIVTCYLLLVASYLLPVICHSLLDWMSDLVSVMFCVVLAKISVGGRARGWDT